MSKASRSRKVEVNGVIVTARSGSFTREGFNSLRFFIFQKYSPEEIVFAPEYVDIFKRHA